MTKRILTVLPLLCVLTFAMGGNAMAPTAAVPTTLSVPDSTPDEFGGCRWYCGSHSYRTAAQCAASCSTACEEIC
jgi:hypothetical protein